MPIIFFKEICLNETLCFRQNRAYSKLKMFCSSSLPMLYMYKNNLTVFRAA